MARTPIVAAIALIGFVVAASASAAVLTATDTATLAPAGDRTGAIVVKCSGNRDAISGGFETEYRLGDPTSPEILMTTFRHNRSSWFSEGLNEGASPGVLTGYSYCAKLDHPLRITFAPSTIAGSPATLTTRATCTQGTAVSGGFVGELNFGGGRITVVPYALRRATKIAWEVTAANVGLDPGGLTAYVVCAKADPGELRVKAVRAEASMVPQGSGAAGSATAQCKAGQRVISGGFEAASYATGVVVQTSKKVGNRGWRVAAYSQVPSTAPLAAIAYCVAA